MTLLAGTILKNVAGNIADKVLKRQDVPIENKNVAATVTKIEAAFVAGAKTQLADDGAAVVKIKSAWLSKINWKSALALVALLASTFGVDISPELQVKILTGAMAASELYNIIVKTWFTGTVTPQSNERADP